MRIEVLIVMSVAMVGGAALFDHLWIGRHERARRRRLRQNKADLRRALGRR